MRTTGGIIMKKMRVPATLAALTLLTGCGSTAVPDTAADSSVTEPADTTAAPTEAPALDGYNLLWHDEFDGSALDETIWNYEPHEPGWTNEELQEYTTSTDNVFLRDGNLVIKSIKKEKNGSDYYTSGKVTAQNKKDFTYCKVVARAKVPAGQGLWPAIWMMPQDEQHYGQWP